MSRKDRCLLLSLNERYKTLPAELELVYSADVPIQSQIDRLIDRIEKLVVALTAKPGDEGNPASVSRLEERIDWHRKVGWGAIGLFAPGIIFLFGFVFLQMPRTSDVKNTVNDGVNPLNDKLSAINQKLAVIETKLELQAGVDNLSSIKSYPEKEQAQPFK